MGTMNKSMLIFFYEIIERIVRFVLHLEEIEEQFYADNENKKALIGDYKIQLWKLFSWLVSKKDDTSNLLENLKTAQELINKLHTEYLSILPRPHEPVELTRFERVIKTQIVKLNKERNLDVSIAINEEIGENAQTDYLHEFKEFFKRKINVSSASTDNQQDVSNHKLFITIPRIDASNTFRWPSLIHEMCHFLIGSINFQKDNIELDFLSSIGREVVKNNIFAGFFTTQIKRQRGQINKDGAGDPEVPDLSKWLTECWCDLFACILIGPSFYFSQFTVFLNSCNEQSIVSHPPHQLRLALIESIISHRFKQLYCDVLCIHIDECRSLIEKIQNDCEFNFENHPILNDIYTFFNVFFLDLFFKSDTGEAQIKDNPDISKNLRELIQKYVTIQSDVIVALTNRLKQKLPIPSIRIGNSKETYEEIPTYVQEMFLASWLAKLPFDSNNSGNLGLIEETMESLDTIVDVRESFGEIKKKIIRHDKAVLKSIQVSEWFDLLTEEKMRDGNIDLFPTNANELDKILDDFDKHILDNSNSILVDKEIKSLIFQDKLKIIPLMYCGQNIQDKERKQIGTTSIDIRLGTSFQVFYPDQYGIVDFAHPKNTYSFKDSSKRIDLDFLEDIENSSITIAPGQFLLGHSMEYVKLPDSICGNLEGRSSFARLGIEIHMTAGFIDPGFEGVITFEIYNAGPTTVRLYPGMRIGQIRFEKNSVPDNPYNEQNVKYKGLLEHNVSLQSKDIEVELIKQYLDKYDKTL
jgi:dCTP deaminase